MDSKMLIKHCNDAGVPVKSSALAAISPQERRIVLDFLAGRAKTEKSEPDDYVGISTQKESSLALSKATINIATSQGIQIGDNDSQMVITSIEVLIKVIEATSASLKQKRDAKKTLKVFLLNSLVSNILGAAASKLLEQLG